MGKKVSAAQAARLADRNERIIRGWIKSGKLHAEKPEGTRDWQIDVDDLANMPGVKLVPREDEARDSTLSDRIEALEARMARLESLIEQFIDTGNR